MRSPEGTGGVVSAKLIARTTTEVWKKDEPLRSGTLTSNVARSFFFHPGYRSLD